VAMAGVLATRPGGNHQAVACIDLYLRQFHTSNGDGGLRTMVALRTALRPLSLSKSPRP
jgi:hypothetical protein